MGFAEGDGGVKGRERAQHEGGGGEDAGPDEEAFGGKRLDGAGGGKGLDGDAVGGFVDALDDVAGGVSEVGVLEEDVDCLSGRVDDAVRAAVHAEAATDAAPGGSDAGVVHGQARAAEGEAAGG